jgi:hypothetical protein
MAADVKKKSFVIHGFRNATDIGRISFQDRDLDSGFGEQVSRRESGWARTDANDRFSARHFF